MLAAILSLLALVLSVTDSVNAHGYVQEVSIGGQKYPGWLPFTDQYKDPQPQTVIRHLPNDGPVMDVHDPALACNVGGENGTQEVATAPAGSNITFTWNQWLSDHLGPVSVYMASCNGACTTFNTKDAKWAKIDAAGYDPKTKKWASEVLISNGNSWTSLIPASLIAGEYLFRNEIIALHSTGAPQFYPSCAQVKVTGGGRAKPSQAQLISIPGIYDYVPFPNIWSDSFNNYTIPGPRVFGGGANNNASPPINVGSPPPSSTRALSDTPNATSPPPNANGLPFKAASAPPTKVPSATPSGRCRRDTRRSSRIANRHAFANRHH